MRRLSFGLIAAVALSLSVWSTPTTAAAAAGGVCAPNAVSCPPVDCGGSACTVGATNPPTPSSTTPPRKGSGGGGNAPCIDINGDTVPCYEPTFGWFNPSDSCYYKPLDPSPPPSDPAWEGHYPNGAIYQQTCYWVHGTGGAWAWLATPPPGMPTVTPAQLAQQALATLHVPDLVMRRSPTEANSDHGTPYTWVNLWTWFWTDPASWKVQTARATAGPVWAEVTVTPTQLIISPGETGTANVTCSGPGRPWTQADGNGAPSGGGCGVVYRHVSAVPITATVAVEWAVTWQGSGGASGTLPVMRTQSSATFAVEQIQVVTR
ncbi:MAG TPA: hypothetical protein VFP72_16465 [Kineosporiaceae bacterium]|nr:hypothetical protein [Kineosporiaceae bacterium]